MNKAEINVTPLIDVLLVLLIIFMIVAPTKPSAFKAKIPQEPKTDLTAYPNPHTLVVAIEPGSTLRLNTESRTGTIERPEAIVERLKTVFGERRANLVYAENLAARTDLSEEEKIEKTVFIKAPKSIDYGSVAKVIDAVKTAGANPISLQIDNLE